MTVDIPDIVLEKLARMPRWDSVKTANTRFRLFWHYRFGGVTGFAWLELGLALEAASRYVASISICPTPQSIDLSYVWLL